MVKMTTYKTCAVPMCENTTISHPDKLFIHVPKANAKRRRQWLQLARRDLRVTSVKSTMYFCEDHFDMPKDMENYMKYCVMGKVKKIMMKPDCLPTKFVCQSDRVKRTAPPQPRSAVSKRWHIDIIKEIFSKEMPATSDLTSNSDLINSAAKTDVVSTNFRVKVKVQTTSQSKNKKLSKCKRKIEAKHKHRISIENTIRLIMKKPEYYIGLSKDCYFLIDLIQKHTKLPKEHILLCLKKIKINTPFSELGDQFGMSEAYVRKNFKKSLPIIANLLRLFIIKTNKADVKENLPSAFANKYHNLNCIFDCLVIEIEEPPTSIEQALTWSECKKANTIKYLISSTPKGMINYISPGYGGSITDVSLLHNCGFLDYLVPGVSIPAERFKRTEELLQNQVNLIDRLKTPKERLSEFSMLKPVVNKNMLKYIDDCIIIACALINVQDNK